MNRLKGSSNLRPPAWPIKQFVAAPDVYQRSVELRNTQLWKKHSMHDLVRFNEQLLAAKRTRQEAATYRNSLVKTAKRTIVKKDTLQESELKIKASEAKLALANADRYVTDIEYQLAELADSVPNLIAPSVVKVSEKGKDFEVLELLRPDERIAADPARDHVEIARSLGMLDLEAGSRGSGTGHYYLMGAGATLEHALIAFALEKCRSFGFQLVIPPTLVREEMLNACGFRPRDESDVAQIYRVKGGSDLVLVGTAEISLAAQYAHRIVSDTQMHVGVSRSYRAEAGARGADTRGLYRVHEFTKVEMFVWTSPSKSEQMHEKLLEIQKSIVDDLELPARVINLAAHDLGHPAYQKYDIEAWMPGRGSFGEISSASNCLDFQSRRLHTKNAENEYVHTLNATALAVPRVIIALIENFWDPVTESIHLPKSLRPYFGAECLKKENHLGI